MHFFWIYLILINALALLLMHRDKRKARQHQWRIPETVLLCTALLGGSIGGMIGMAAFRHKTKKPKFYLGFPMIFILETAACIYLFCC